MNTKLLVLLSLASVFTLCNSACPNHCSGNGRCTNYKAQFSTASDSVSEITLPTVSGTVTQFGYDTSVSKKDSCTCFAREESGSLVYAWTGADCSLKTCPHGNSWDAGILSSNNHNKMTECSSRGRCDRSNGKCACEVGYEGKACQRQSCPNQCSGNGVCKTLKEIAKLNSENNLWDSLSGMNYANIRYSFAWDANMVRGCECDKGFRGPDCSIKECPSSADPMGGQGSESGRECSGRGLCVEGICQCFKGFFGTDCGAARAQFS